ncbi:MAG TPA: zinc-finger domain-containing protein [Paenalcaligenes sp.]|nr:zinc-finger domain-containing protein [Paenalcaligenes sp.]
MNQPHTKAIDVVYVDESDLPVYCPGPNSPLWSMHPRVYIEIETSKKAQCPYCGAQYQLRHTPATDTDSEADHNISAP